MQRVYSIHVVHRSLPCSPMGTTLLGPSMAQSSGDGSQRLAGSSGHGCRHAAVSQRVASKNRNRLCEATGSPCVRTTSRPRIPRSTQASCNGAEPTTAAAPFQNLQPQVSCPAVQSQFSRGLARLAARTTSVAASTVWFPVAYRGRGNQSSVGRRAPCDTQDTHQSSVRTRAELAHLHRLDGWSRCKHSFMRLPTCLVFRETTCCVTTRHSQRATRAACRT